MSCLLIDGQITHLSNRAPSWTPLRKTDEQLIQVIWGLGVGQGRSKRGIWGVEGSWGLRGGWGLGV